LLASFNEQQSNFALSVLHFFFKVVGAWLGDALAVTSPEPSGDGAFVGGCVGLSVKIAGASFVGLGVVAFAVGERVVGVLVGISFQPSSSGGTQIVGEFVRSTAEVGSLVYGGLLPQSVQSLAYGQKFDREPVAPSSQMPSLALKHKSLQVTAEVVAIVGVNASAIASSSRLRHWFILALLIVATEGALC